jgi:N-acetylneuraminic acid mutarotase
MNYRPVVFVVGLLIVGCGGGGGGSQPAPSAPTPPALTPPAPSIAVSGAVQKGPFLVGSTVLINWLDNLGRPTASTIVSQVEDSIGSFDFVSTEPGPVQIVATGYYFSELTGQPSSGTLTLRALYQIGTQSTQKAYVNMLTHLINDRALDLLAAGGNVTLSSAIAQAEGELLTAFQPALPITGISSFSGLNIYNVSTGAPAASGNAYLLAISTAFYKYAATKAAQFGTATDAELTLILNRLSDDLADDGDIDEAGFMTDFIRAVRSLSPETIIDHLRSRSLVDYSQGLSVPDISTFLQLCAGDADCAWRAGAPTPTKLVQTSSAALGGKVYYFGGIAPLGTTQDAVFEYDVARNEWSPKAPMPIATRLSQAHAIGDKIYIVAAYGERGVQNELLEYTPATNQWRTRAPKPSYRYEFASGVVNGKVYVLGGTGTANDGPPVVPVTQWSLKDYVEIYDPATNTWTTGQRAPAPFTTSNGSCTVGDNIYVFGIGAVLGPAHNTTVWTYDAALDSWSAATPITAARIGATCSVVNGAIYLAGGLAGNGQTEVAVNTVERYDPLHQSWSSPTRLPTRRAGGAAAVVGADIVFMNGESDVNTYRPALDLVEILDTEAL